MSGKGANRWLERVVIAVAERENKHTGKTFGLLGTFAGLMGGMTKQAVSYWIAAGGVPHKHRQRLREVVDRADLNLSDEEFERLLRPRPGAATAARGENEALQAVFRAVRAHGVPLRRLAARMGMSYWQLHRCGTRSGGLPPEAVGGLAEVLRALGIDLPSERLSRCARATPGVPVEESVAEGP